MIVWATMAAWAGPAVGVRYSAGVAGFLGDLSDERGFLQEIEIDTLYLQSNDERVRGYLGINTLWTGVTHTGTAFPFPEGADLQVLGFLFVGNVCGRPTPGLRGCLGLGQGTVNVNSGGEGRDYGTWNYQAHIDVEPWRGLVLFAQGRYVGSIEQRVAGAETAFSFWTASGGVGYTF